MMAQVYECSSQPHDSGPSRSKKKAQYIIVLVLAVAVINFSFDRSIGSVFNAPQHLAQEERLPDECYIKIGENQNISSALDKCNRLKVETSILADSIRAAHPEFDEDLVKNPKKEWFGRWWRKHQHISFPANPEKCVLPATVVRQLETYLGSQTFLDMRAISYSGKTVFRNLDAHRFVYTSASLDPRNDDSKAMSDLRACFIQTQSKNKNSISCLFLPTTDCVWEEEGKETPVTSNPWANDGSMTREASLCGSSEMCIKELARPVPVEPQLSGSLSPDVSVLSLSLFERMTAPSTLLRAALQELTSEILPKITYPCVAVHIRRGDKLPECRDGKETSCAFQKNLTDYTDVAVDFLKQLDKPGSIFVMTDDSTFLKGVEFVNGYPVVSMSGKSPDQLGRESDDLLELVMLLASLNVGSTCDAVVGNSESEVSELLVLYRCMYHGSCPPVHSMNGRPLQAFEGLIVDGRASNVNVEMGQ